MSFINNFFGEGFDVSSKDGNVFYNMVVKNGTTAIWWRRTRGTKDSVSGISPETWNTTKSLFIFSFPIGSSARETPAGQTVEQRHEVHTYVPIPKNDRLQWGGKTYDVELDPENIYYNDSNIYYRHVVMKRD